MFVQSVALLVATLIVVGGGLEAIRSRRDSNHFVPDDPPLVSRLRRSFDDRPRFALVAAIVACSLLVFPFVDVALRAADVAAPFEFWDYGAYTGALDRWQTSEPLYVRNDEGGFSGGYLYPPFFLLVVWPFDPLSFDVGAALLELTSVVFLWLSLQLLVRELDVPLRLWERGLLLWMLVGFHPLLFSVKQGQISAFLSSLLTLALVALLRAEGISVAPHDSTVNPVSGYLSGALTGFVGAVKLVYAPLGAHLLADRRRLVGAVGAGIALLGISLASFGVETHVNYVDVLLWGKAGEVRSPLLWMAPYFRPLYALAPISLPIRLLGCLCVAGLAVAAAHADADTETFVLGVAAMPLLAPQAYSYYLTALLPAFVVMLHLELTTDGRPSLVLLSLFFCHAHSYGLRLAVASLPSLVPYGDAAVPWMDATVVDVVVSLFQPGVWGTLLLAGLAATRVVAAARGASLRDWSPT